MKTATRQSCTRFLLAAALAAFTCPTKAAEVRVVVDRDSEINTMRGGIGASWHAIETPILYRILDWCQQNETDVLLTQMWGNVAWNAFPEFRGTAAGVVHSGPLSIDDFAEGLATCVEHLVKTKGYTCIKWLCITNRLYRYAVSAADRDNAALKVEPEGPLHITSDTNAVTDHFLPQSLTILTTYQLTHSDPGIMAE